MKQQRPLAVLIFFVLTGCGFVGEMVPEVAPTVNEFSIVENNISGCGMALWKPERTAQGPYVFFNRIEDGSMRMSIDGELMTFSRVDGRGQEFYGQQSTQTFRNTDGTITATVTVTLGEAGEIESVAIAEGTIRVERDGATVELPVVGDAGC